MQSPSITLFSAEVPSSLPFSIIPNIISIQFKDRINFCSSFLLEVIDIQKLQTGNILIKKVVTIICLKPEKKTSENISKIISLKLFDYAILPLLSKICLTSIFLTLSWRRFLSYRNQFTHLQTKSIEWFLYDNNLRHERVKGILKSTLFLKRNFILIVYRLDSLTLLMPGGNKKVTHT